MVPTALGETLPAHPGVGETQQTPPRRWIYLAGILIVLAGWAAYSNSFSGEFVFDDVTSILQNPTIQQGWWEALSPPMGTTTVCGRPLVNFSLALNYRLGGFNVWGYHVFNLVIQMLAGLTLFGLVRRTLERPRLRARYGAVALPLAFVVALLWTIHPLQTESVSYIAQRAEAMMGLFYLLTLYCFIRGMESSWTWAWHGLSATICLLGMLTKESMVTAPLIVLLYDRTFIAGTFAAAWRQRWKFYIALAATWVPLAWIVVNVSWPGNSVLINKGMDGLAPAMKSFVYGLKQCDAIVRYLALSFWPHPLIFHYGNEVVANPLMVAPQIVVLALLLGATIYGLWRRPALGFLGAWLFVILAPTSSIVPIKGQTMAEHHMYLSLAAIMVLVVLGLYATLDRRAWIVGLVLALAFGTLTFERNRNYRTETSIWADTLQDRPDSATIHGNFGETLQSAGRVREALACYESALKITPDVPEYVYDIGTVYEQEGQWEQAVAAYLKAIQLNPNMVEAHTNLGNLYLGASRPADAIPHFSTVIRLKPDYGNAYLGLGNALLMNNQASEAAMQFEAALRLMPDSAGTHSNFGVALLKLNRFDEAAREFDDALRLDPNYPNARTHVEQARQLAAPSTPPLNVPKQ